MRKKRATQIRNKVFDDLGYEPTVDDPKKKIIKEPDFKSIYRAAKRNYHSLKQVQHPLIKTSKRQQRISGQKN